MVVELSILTFNVRGLRDYKKRKKIAKWIHDKNIGIVLLQETHSTDTDETFWSSQFKGDCYFSHGTNTSKGVMSIVRNTSLNSNIRYQDEEGRILLIEIKLVNSPCFILNTYAQNKKSDHNFF